LRTITTETINTKYLKFEIFKFDNETFSSEKFLKMSNSMFKNIKPKSDMILDSLLEPFNPQFDKFSDPERFYLNQEE
jgi:hypothetical protein